MRASNDDASSTSRINAWEITIDPKQTVSEQCTPAPIDRSMEFASGVLAKLYGLLSRSNMLCDAHTENFQAGAGHKADTYLHSYTRPPIDKSLDRILSKWIPPELKSTKAA